MTILSRMAIGSGLMLLVAPVTSANDDSDQTYVAWEAAMGRLSSLITAIENADERRVQLYQATQVSKSLREGHLNHAHRAAFRNSLTAPTAQLRREWSHLTQSGGELSRQRQESVERCERHFFEKLPSIWHLESSREIDELLANVDELPEDYQAALSSQLIRAREAAVHWQSIVKLIDEQSYARATQELRSFHGGGFTPEEAVAAAHQTITARIREPFAREVEVHLNLIAAGDDNQVQAAIDSWRSSEVVQAAAQYFKEFPAVNLIGDFTRRWEQLSELREIEAYDELLPMIDRLSSEFDQPDLQQRLTKLKFDTDRDFEQMLRERKAEIARFISNPPDDYASLPKLSTESFLKWRIEPPDERIEEVKNLYKATQHWQRARLALSRDNFEEFIDELRWVEHHGGNSLLAEEIERMRETFADRREQIAVERITELKQRIAASTTAEQARGTESWWAKTKQDVGGEHWHTAKVLVEIAELWRTFHEEVESDRNGSAHGTLDVIRRTFRGYGIDSRWLEPTLRAAEAELVELGRPFLEQVEEKMTAVANGAELQPAYAAVAAASEHGFGKEIQADLQNLLQDLETLIALESKLHQTDRSQTAKLLWHRPTRPHRWMSITLKYEASLIYKRIKETGQLPWLEFRDDAGVRAMLDRAVDEASASGDWQRLLSVLQLQLALLYTSFSGSSEQKDQLRADIAALEHHCRGDRYREAQEFALARAEYEQALRHRSARLPKSHIERALDNLPERSRQ